MIINDGDKCTLLEVIQSEPGSTFVCYEPACPPNAKAYKQWESIIIERHKNAVVVVESKHKGYRPYQLLNLSGMAIESVWMKLYTKGK
ncbi:hypothetical protein M3_0165 [Lysinibacillus phage vB_LfM_LysYB1]|nr:hypothetical protein M3_0165 [Lysinibacillus phage vB_LfM_LysYB1]WAB25324.1 hypothetical protein M5_0146 [Lysinibacillus phage vB_LfM_LysYB2]